MFLFLQSCVRQKKENDFLEQIYGFESWKCLTSNLIANNLTPMFAQLKLCKFRGENKLFMCFKSANDWQF